MKPAVDQLWAQALAYAFLDGDWTTEGLTRRGGDAVGHRRPSLRALVRRVLRAYPRPPADRPRELTAWILADAARRRGQPQVASWPARWTFFQPAMGDMPWPVPAMPTSGELAHFLDITVNELAWFADTRSLERLVADEKLRNYRYRWVTKRSGGSRLIELPKQRLRRMQRLILATILNRIPIHESAHGFVRGRSAITFAHEHAGARTVIRFDLQDFFGSIGAGRVYGLFRTAGYPESVAHALTGLATNVVPRNVWEAAPRPRQTSDAIHDHFMLGRRLATPHLPQGAPTSPALANLCAHGLDRRLRGLAEASDLHYSRYADDLAFSGAPSRTTVARVQELVRDIAREEGFKVNDGKTVVMGRGQRQRLAGVVINQRPNLDRRAYDRLRATLHNAALNGLDAENREGHKRFAEHLAGRVSWAVNLNDGRARVLDRLLAEATSAS
ncbi:MAG TPA: reverse transcriptase family protein [Candidatus Dormibacteraeota bacterium]|nr:reverse transcriptase family protein [Candidatus Dormibacteraeota bacterium]